MSDEVVVEARDRWAPSVVRRDGELLLLLHVASGHTDVDVELPVGPRHVEVLRDDPRRYWCAYAALHHPFQLAATRLTVDEVTAWLDLILLAPRARAEAFLTGLDHGRARGAVSHLVSLGTGTAQDELRAGRWLDD